jgi:hypothetical protein
MPTPQKTLCNQCYAALTLDVMELMSRAAFIRDIGDAKALKLVSSLHSRCGWLSHVLHSKLTYVANPDHRLVLDRAKEPWPT